MGDNATELVNIIREIAREEFKKKDCAIFCNIQEQNIDGSVNITLPSDENVILYNIPNYSKFNFKNGDIAILYKMENKLNNSFIIGKVTLE